MLSYTSACKTTLRGANGAENAAATELRRRASERALHAGVFLGSLPASFWATVQRAFADVASVAMRFSQSRRVIIHFGGGRQWLA
jgi:hypothetical protein